MPGCGPSPVPDEDNVFLLKNSWQGYCILPIKCLTLNTEPRTEELCKTTRWLYWRSTITEAEIAKSMLDSAGIWSTIRNEYMSAIYPIGTMPAQIVVREEDYEKAKAMLHHR